MRIVRASQLLMKSQQSCTSQQNIYKRQLNRNDELSKSCNNIQPLLPRESIGNFRQKLNRLEQNKQVLEERVKKFERDMRSKSPSRYD